MIKNAKTIYNLVLSAVISSKIMGFCFGLACYYFFSENSPIFLFWLSLYFGAYGIVISNCIRINKLLKGEPE